jgi:hypothetical protein
MKKKIILGVFLLLGAVVETAEASYWQHQATLQGPGGCVEEHYSCERGFGFAFCQVGSTRVVITCPPGGGNPSGGLQTIEPSN